MEQGKEMCYNLLCHDTSNKNLREIRATLHQKCKELFTQFPLYIAYTIMELDTKNIKQLMLTTPNQGTMRKPATIGLYCTYNPNQWLIAIHASKES